MGNATLMVQVPMEQAVLEYKEVKNEKEVEKMPFLTEVWNAINAFIAIVVALVKQISH